ncbi:peroxidase family protein [Methylobacterium sp. JK268]
MAGGLPEEVAARIAAGIEAKVAASASGIVLPEVARVRRLFSPPDEAPRRSRTSTCLVPAFGQYLTDCLRRPGPQAPGLDLRALYGRTPAQTASLRLSDGARGWRGRLRSQVFNGEEYAPFLYDGAGRLRDPAFAALDRPARWPPGAAPPLDDQMETLFAFGGRWANATPLTAMINTLLMREHNRVAGEVERRNPDFDDERVFQTARRILVASFARLAAGEFLGHLAPPAAGPVADLPPDRVPGPVGATAVVLGLACRWHGLLPESIGWRGRGRIPVGALGLDNAPLLDVGLHAALAAASAEPAAEPGPLNTAPALQAEDDRLLALGRAARLAPYNRYRVAYGLAPARSIAEINPDPAVAGLLADLYGDADRVELYPGLVAEPLDEGAPLPALARRMIVAEIRSQSRANPLVAESAGTAETFTPWGLDLLREPVSLRELVRRNTGRDDAGIGMSAPGRPVP